LSGNPPKNLYYQDLLPGPLLLPGLRCQGSDGLHQSKRNREATAQGGEAPCPVGEVWASGRASTRKVTSVLAFLLIAGLCVVLALIILCIMASRLAKTKHVVVTGRVDLVRAQTRVEAAEHAVSVAAERHRETARLAADSVATTRSALYVARQIGEVNGKMDTLLSYFTDESAELPSRGREDGHPAELLHRRVGRTALPGTGRWTPC
jgi:hypothetical protein